MTQTMPPRNGRKNLPCSGRRELPCSGRRKLRCSGRRELRCSGVILAGGLNSRFQGTNKARLAIEGQSLLDRILGIFTPLFDEVILVTNAPEQYLDVDALIVSDHYGERSSLNGIYSGLFAARNPFAFVCACDAPFVQEALVKALLDEIDTRCDVVLPQTEKGIEPLFAAYGKNCLEPMRRQIEAGRFKIRAFFDKVRVRNVPAAILKKHDPELRSFININTPEALRTILAIDGDG